MTGEAVATAVPGWPDSLVFRITLAVASGVVIVVALLVLLSVWLMRGETRGTTGRHLTTTVSRVADEIDANLFLRARALNAVREELQSMGAPLPPAVGRRFLHTHSALKSMFTRVVLLTPDLKVAAAEPPGADSDIVRELGDPAIFSAAREQRQLVISEPYPTSARAVASIVFAVPVFVADGTFAGVLVGALDLGASGFFDSVRDARVGETGYFTVTTGAGLTLMHPTAERQLEPAPSLSQNPALRQALAGHFAWSEGPTEDGAAAISAYDVVKQTRWIVGVVLPTAEAYGPMHRIEALVMTVGLVAALAVAALVWVVASINVAPLRRIRRQLDRVGRAINQLLDSQSRMQNTLRTRESFHRKLNESSPLGIFVLDREGQCTFVNRRFEQLAGQPFTGLSGEGWIDAISEGDREAIRLNWQSAFKARRTFVEEFRYNNESGTAWVQLRAEPLAQADEGEEGYVGAVVDITAQRQSWFALQREKWRADRIMGAIEDALVVVDGEGNVVHLSPAAERLTGWERSAVVGASVARVLRLFHETDDQPVDLASEMRREKFTVDQWVCDTAASPRLPVEVSWTPIEDVAGQDETLGGVLVLRNAAERRAASRRSEWDANHDALTQLPNRRAFENALREAHARFQRDSAQSALILVDLDRFKQVNDLGGHDAGDEMLVKVAACLKHAARASDLAARLGGDEFALLLPGCSNEHAAAIAERLAATVNALRVVRGAHVLSIGVSQGISAFATDDLSTDEIKARADAACYRAKRAGGGRGETELASEALA